MRCSIVVVALAATLVCQSNPSEAQTASRPFQQAFATISNTLANPSQALSTVQQFLPSGGIFPFSISNLPSLPPIRFPQRVPQMIGNGIRNATTIIRNSLMSPVGATVAVLGAPLGLLGMTGGPANLAGASHSMNNFLFDFRSHHGKSINENILRTYLKSQRQAN